ncbi:MAG: hypothetical protein IJ884_08315 [Bacteroidales bacterium]|nr:hypothetical protein [Bacteroidales bacterium]
MGGKIDFSAFRINTGAAVKPAAKKLAEEPEAEPLDEQAEEHKRTVQTFKTWDTQKKMRIMSEANLSEALDWHMEDGTAYHVISYGDVDSLTFLRHIVRQQRLRYVFVATWCMATKDAEEMRDWVRRGMIGRMDFYVGEIFKSGYRGCLDVLDDICKETGGRTARIRNHSKLMAFFGERFSGVIESSANVDTNPRIEQTCITINEGLAEFYKEFFDQMIDYDGRYKDWRPFDLKGGAEA